MATVRDPEQRPARHPIAAAQVELRRREAAWRRQRAEVARLIAAGEEAAAARLRAEIGDPVGPAEAAVAPSPAAPSPTEAPTPPTRTPTPTPEPTPTPTDRRKPHSAGGGTPTVGTRESDLARSPRPGRRVRRRRPHATWGGWLKTRPPWALSLTAHGVLLAVLALATFASLADTPVFLTVALDEADAGEEVAEVTLSSPPAEVEADVPSDDAMESLESIDLQELIQPVSFEAITDIAPVDGLPNDLGALLADAGTPDGGESKPSSGAAENSGESTGDSGDEATTDYSPPGPVRFFGAESRANRVAFVVDNSGSMQYGRMETTLVELQRAVKRLSASQSFYVVFFSDQAYPMFFPEPVEEMLPATRENKRRLSKWLPTVEMCLGGRLLDAVELAASLEPEVVYLLSDGDIRSSRVMSALTDTEAWDFPIHALAMGARDKDDAAKMAAIAEANDGGYKFVQARPQSLLQARRKPIRYNRTPGPVWGSQVQVWTR